MDEVDRAYPYMQRTGKPFEQYFGLIAEGFYNTWEEVNDPNRPVSIWNNNKLQPGDVKYKDVNGDGIINNNDMVPIALSLRSHTDFHWEEVIRTLIFPFYFKERQTHRKRLQRNSIKAGNKMDRPWIS